MDGDMTVEFGLGLSLSEARITRGLTHAERSTRIARKFLVPWSSTTLCGPLSHTDVAAGQRVKQGRVLGKGSYWTGNHLHFKIRINDATVDPLKYLP
jgi:murein DD-endopeptidase MepM/ murein hydrolase activator NlpD